MQFEIIEFPLREELSAAAFLAVDETVFHAVVVDIAAPSSQVLAVEQRNEAVGVGGGQRNLLDERFGGGKNRRSLSSRIRLQFNKMDIAFAPSLRDVDSHITGLDCGEAMRKSLGGGDLLVIRNVRDALPCLAVFRHFYIIGIGAGAVPIENGADGVDFRNTLHINLQPRGALVSVPSVPFADETIDCTVWRVILFLFGTERNRLPQKEIRPRGERWLGRFRIDFEFDDMRGEIGAVLHNVQTGIARHDRLAEWMEDAAIGRCERVFCGVYDFLPVGVICRNFNGIGVEATAVVPMEDRAEGIDGNGFLQIDGEGAGPWIAPPCAIDIDDTIRRKFLWMTFFGAAGDGDRLVESNVDAFNVRQSELRTCTEDERLVVAQRNDFFHGLAGSGVNHAAIIDVRRADNLDSGCRSGRHKCLVIKGWQHNLRQYRFIADVSCGGENKRVLFIGETIALNFLEVGDDCFHRLVFLRGIEAEQAFQCEIVMQFRLLFGGEFVERLNGAIINPIRKGADSTVLEVLIRALQI